MQYDPIKKSLGKVFNRTPFLRILFYRLLDLLLLRAWHIRKEIKLWSKKVGNDINVLDAGSGFGQYVYFLSSLNKDWNITGLDVKTEQIEDCNQFFTKIKRNEKVHFEYADLTKFEEVDKYDLVISVDVMEHIEDDEGVFKNIHNAMISGGMMIISTPSDQGGSDAHHHEVEHEDGVTGFIDEHVRDGYNIQEIKQKLQKAGFKNVVAHYTYGWPGKISWKLSMKFPIMMLNLSKLFFIILPVYYIITFPISFILNFIDVKIKHKTGTGLLVKAIK
ncbi:class I SAM-dependent methyltransferase [Plebeiibacterium sediminum]|uniref:Class I SAM-dependent methyltransferase n=1 Tax=Plebeiibacterium sediminum TaxID=2992112 RepID=A0AAE3M7J0_9BACT|nr:class I SAM-dependent methyltransferase [Plebeiobacterium sediminum]MCW3788726.1 class I SAM-dependent methyltransferase [Plebeiobacterium sediminum]